MNGLSEPGAVATGLQRAAFRVPTLVGLYRWSTKDPTEVGTLNSCIAGAWIHIGELIGRTS